MEQINQNKLKMLKFLLQILVWIQTKKKIFGSSVVADSTTKVAEIKHVEKEKMKEKDECIFKHGINCFINRQLMYN